MAPASATPPLPPLPPPPPNAIVSATVAPHHPIGNSLHLIEKLLCRLKVIKRGHHQPATIADQPALPAHPASPAPPTQPTQPAPPAITKSTTPTQSEVTTAVPATQSVIEIPSTDITEQVVEPAHEEIRQRKHRIELSDIAGLCDELGNLLQSVRDVQDLSTFTGSYPSVLQRRLDNDALELRSVYNEVREALHNIVRVKEQRRAVRKERVSVTKALAKIRDQEVREMEGLITQFDKALMTRWEKLRNTTQPELIENLLNDMKGKHQALDHLNTLATQKLSQLAHGSTTSPTATTSAMSSAPPGFTSSLLRDENKPGSSSASNRRNSISGCVRSNGMRWRKHHERGTRSASSRNGQETLPLPLVPLALNPTPAPAIGITIMPLTAPAAAAAAATATTTTTTSATNSSNSLPSSPGSSVIPPNTPSAPPLADEECGFHLPRTSNDTNGILTLAGPACSAGGLLLAPGATLMPERRSMLHALFGEIRRSADGRRSTDGHNNAFVTLNPVTNIQSNPGPGSLSTAVVVTAPEESLLATNGVSTNDQTSTNGGNSNQEGCEIELFTINRPS